MNPAHDTVHPSGQANVVHQDKPLSHMIDDFKRCAVEKPTTVTWAFTKTYTKDEWESLDVSESNDLVKLGYIQIMDEWENSVGFDSLSLSYTIDKEEK